MRSIKIESKFNNNRIDEVLKQKFSKMSLNAMYKAFREKDIKVNGKRVPQNEKVFTDDKVDIYIVDDVLDGLEKRDQIYSKSYSKTFLGFDIIYEDDNLLIVEKEQGLLVHPDREQSTDTLIDKVQMYLKNKNTQRSNLDGLTLCHRIDRNTGGLVIIAKHDRSLKFILDKMQKHEIKKHYRCFVLGKMEPKTATIKAYLSKDEKKAEYLLVILELLKTQLK